MSINAISSFLVYPGKNDVNPRDALGTQLKLTGSLFHKLREVFERSEKECTVPIRFSMGIDGSQNNPVRSLIHEYLVSPTLENGLVLANRLRDLTTKKPGLGLFFIMSGVENKHYKIVLSRFPAEEGILAEEVKDELKIQYIERIFMKNAASYKAALYEGSSFENDFWDGYIVDRQLDEPANYWIYGFLMSEYLTTAKFGTQRIAKVLKEVTRSAISLQVKQEIVAAMILAKGQFGKPISVPQFINQMGLSKSAQTAILDLLPKDVIDDTFILDEEEFLKIVPLSGVVLDTGGILIAPSERYDECITRELVDPISRQYKFTAVGKIVDEKLRGNG